MRTNEKDSQPFLKGTDLQDVKGKLQYLDISTVYTCNARCVDCYAAWGGVVKADQQFIGSRLLTVLDWLHLLPHLLPYFQTTLLSGLGETTSEKNWPEQKELVEFVHGNSAYTLMYTNGLTMNGELAEWIGKHSNLSIIGKWYHTNPKENDRLLGLKPDHKYSGKYGQIAGATIPLHIQILKEHGLTADNRLGLQCTVSRDNIDVIPAMWKFCRENNIIPTFSWIVPTGLGKLSRDRNRDLDIEQKRTLTQTCWEIDIREFGINWDLQLGPHIGSSKCEDDKMLYLGPFGEMRRCSSDRNKPLAMATEIDVPTLIAIKAIADRDSSAFRSQATGAPTCVCTLCNS